MDVKQRVNLLRAAETDTSIQQLLLRQCERDIIFWFNTFAWTFDPRIRWPHLPFELYDFQADFITEVCAAIEGGNDLLLEKSRDMGASWLVLLIFLWYWLFKPGSNFHLGSRKEAFVDERGNISTLMEKCRYALRRLPPWMRPAGFKTRLHDLDKRLINPTNGNAITGESSNPSFSRSGRYKAILFDEFAFWATANQAFAASGESSPCRLVVSTPYGKSNRFAQLRFNSHIKVVTLHWTRHPKKDAAWYAFQQLRYTEDEIAREIDINYNLSVGAVVFKEFNARAHLISGAYQFKPEWKTVAAFDFGTTTCCLLGQIDPHDTLHLFKELILFQNGNTEDIGQAYLNYAAKLPLTDRVYFFGDPAGNTREFKTRAMTTDMQVLASLGIGPVVHQRSKELSDRLQAGITLMKKLFGTRYQGKERIQIYEDDCPKLVEALQSEYKYKTLANGDRLDIIDEKHPYEDVMDCLRYLIIENFHVAMPKTSTPIDYAPDNMYFEG